MLHIIVALLLIFGLPSIWNPEVIEEPIRVKLATLADISAAPKVDRPSDKKPEKKPEPAPEQPKPEPPKPEQPKAAPPPPAQSQSTPPPPEKKPEPVPEKKPEPQPEKKPEPKPEKKPEKKPEEKKPEKKPDKKQQQDFNSLLNNVLKQDAAPSKEEAPKKSNSAPPQESTSGPQTDQISEIPMTATEEDGIRAQIEANWDIDPGQQGFEDLVIEIRVSMTEDGTVTDARIINEQSGNGVFRAAADKALRAVKISSPLKLPPGKYWPTLVLRFRPSEVVR